MTALQNPKSSQEAVEIIINALQSGQKLALQGGGTKEAIGPPMKVSQILSSANLTGITLYEPSELVIAARSGTPLSEIEDILAQHNQRLSFDPPSYQGLLASAGIPTLGAVAACNLSGPRRISHGAARDSLIGMELINGKGDLIKNGGRVMKNVTGYDLTKLICGSWGTLGLLTQLCFKVQPKPETQTTLVFYDLDDHAAVSLMTKALASPFEVTSAAHISPDWSADQKQARTMLRMEGFETSLHYRSAELTAQLQTFGKAECFNEQTSTLLWQSVKGLSDLETQETDLLWKISLKPTNAPIMAAWLRNTYDAKVLLDWSGGLIWAALAISPNTQQDGAAKAIRHRLAQLGGHATLIKAPKNVRETGLSFHPPAQQMSKLIKAVKQSFDPYGIFNPDFMTKKQGE
ncbi:MAG: glycolate oxidase subunit GlcE [Cohaesibacter sp.]|nr:glycolate oxidase subunit GlcE [Cohaesibacter sp.]